MIAWLKFFFLGFFSDKLSAEAERRSGLNVLLGYVLALIIVCGGLTAGYAASFKPYYKAADEFKEFYRACFSGGGISATLKGGKLTSEISGGAEYINGFDDESSSYNKNGYRLVVDTRPAATTFDDFTLKCTDGDGKDIDYEDYVKLDDSKKKMAVVYSGKSLDVAANMDKYTAHLDAACVEGADGYDADIAKDYADLKAKKSEMSEYDYNNQTYLLYIRSYCPSLKNADPYGGAPTLRSYYMNTDMSEGTGKYLMLLDDILVCSFESKGVFVDFAGSYGTKRDVTTVGLSGSELNSSLDTLLCDAFNGGGTVNFIVYIMNMLRFSLIIIGAILILSLILRILSKLKKTDFCKTYFACFKLGGSYLTVSALLAAIVGFVMSFFMSRITVYTAVGYILLALILIRTVVYVLHNFIRFSRERADATEESGETAEDVQE